MDEAGMILEGGAMRSMFSAGVLDSFLDTESTKKFITSTVNCLTGEAVYYDEFDNVDNFLSICQAANSLPFIAKITKINGIPMLDGGMADAIPIAKALEEGWKKVIVVMTRNKDYRNGQRSGQDVWPMKIDFRVSDAMLS